MNESKESVPKIRFPGFTDALEQRRLSDGTSKIGDGLHGTPIYTDDGNVYFINGNNLVNGKIVITEETKRVTEVEQSKDDKALDDNALLMSINGTIGNLALYNGEKLMLGKSAAYITVSDFDKRFIYAYLQTPSIHNYFMNNLTGSTIKNLGLKTIRETKLLVPAKEEQAKIGRFFQNLDNLITLHQRKLNSVKNLKAGLLQKMFPKDGEDFPEVRFPGFTQAWEKRKLFDNLRNIIDFRGRTPKKLGLDWSESGYLALSALNVKDGYIDPSVDAHYGNQELYDKWMTGHELRKGQVLFTTEAPMGNVAQVPDNTPYILSQRTIAFDVQPEMITDDFLFVLLRSPNVFAELSALSSGGTAKGVSQKSLSQLSIIVPKDLDEQTQFASFFSNFDNLISLHQRKLEHLQKQKKALLQQMFV